MSTYLRPTELAKYLDVAPQKISQLRARGIITREQDGSYEADATRVAYIRNLRAHVVPAASASLTEERALLLRARRARMELETARMRGGTITPEEDERRLEMIRSRLEDIPAGYSNGIAEAARRADGINQANAAVGARLRSAITEDAGNTGGYHRRQDLEDRRMKTCMLRSRCSSRVSRFGRRAVRLSDMSEIGGEAEVRGLR
jgi:hypothetical protein